MGCWDWLKGWLMCWCWDWFCFWCSWILDLEWWRLLFWFGGMIIWWSCRCVWRICSVCGCRIWSCGILVVDWLLIGNCRSCDLYWWWWSWWVWDFVWVWWVCSSFWDLVYKLWLDSWCSCVDCYCCVWWDLLWMKICSWCFWCFCVWFSWLWWWLRVYLCWNWRRLILFFLMSWCLWCCLCWWLLWDCCSFCVRWCWLCWR